MVGVLRFLCFLLFVSLFSYSVWSPTKLMLLPDLIPRLFLLLLFALRSLLVAMISVGRHSGLRDFVPFGKTSIFEFPLYNKNSHLYRQPPVK